MLSMNRIQIIKNQDIEELRELGSGGFWKVYHAKWRGTDVAVKWINPNYFDGTPSEVERLTSDFWREVEIVSKLRHPNIVPLYGVIQDGPGRTLALVYEYLRHGTLGQMLRSKERYLSARQRISLATGVAFGMEYLHSKNIVHFDLKADNLLVNLDDPRRPICKVSDFSLTRLKRNTLVSGNVRGILPWMAPELLNGSNSLVSEKVDVYSFGIVLWEILTGEEPYADMHYGAIIGGIVSNTLRPPVPNYCDPDWAELMKQCWDANPNHRPSFSEIARHLHSFSVKHNTMTIKYAVAEEDEDEEDNYYDDDEEGGRAEEEVAEAFPGEDALSLKLGVAETLVEDVAEAFPWKEEEKKFAKALYGKEEEEEEEEEHEALTEALTVRLYSYYGGGGGGAEEEEEVAEAFPKKEEEEKVAEAFYKEQEEEEHEALIVLQDSCNDMEHEKRTSAAAAEAFSWEPATELIIKDEDLEVLRELGAGTFGTVYHGKWKGIDVAIKQVKGCRFTRRSEELERKTRHFWHEAEVLSKLSHPNVIPFCGVVQEDSGETLANVTEYMEDGSLRRVLQRKGRNLERHARLCIAKDVALGMEYLHLKGVVHFDLKSDNLLVNLKDPSRPICKICDFGLAKTKGDALLPDHIGGTLPWMAPELLNGSCTTVSEKADIFAFGIVMWELITMEIPYSNMRFAEILGGIVSNKLRPPVPFYCDLDWKSLMEQCWAYDPESRPSFSEIFKRLSEMPQRYDDLPNFQVDTNITTDLSNSPFSTLLFPETVSFVIGSRPDLLDMLHRRSKTNMSDILNQLSARDKEIEQLKELLATKDSEIQRLMEAPEIPTEKSDAC